MLEGWGDFSTDNQRRLVRLGTIGFLVAIIAIFFWQILTSQGSFPIKQDYAASSASALLLIERPAVEVTRQGQELSEVLSGMLLQAGDEVRLQRQGRATIDFLSGDRLVAQAAAGEGAGSSDGRSGMARIQRAALGKNQQDLALTEELVLSAGDYWLRLRGQVQIGQAVLATPIGADGSPSSNQPAAFSLNYNQGSGMLNVRVFSGGLAVSQAGQASTLPVVAGEQLSWYVESALTNADIAELALPLRDWEQANLQTQEQQLYQQAVAAADEAVASQAAQELALYQAYLQGDVPQARELSGLSGRSAIRHYLNLMPANQFDFTNVVQSSPPAVRDVMKAQLGSEVAARGTSAVAGSASTMTSVPASSSAPAPGAAASAPSQASAAAAPAASFPASERALSVDLKVPALQGQQGDNLVALWYFLPLKAGGAIYIEEVPTLGQESYKLLFPLAAKPAFFPANSWPAGEYLVRVLWRGQVLEEKNFQVISS